MTDAATEVRAKFAARLLNGDEDTPAIRPAVTFADHSYPAYSKMQMLDFALQVAALSTPTPAGELREVNTRRLLIEAALCLSGFAGEGLCVEGFDDPADVYGRIVAPLELQNADDDDLRRALAQPGSGEGV